MRSHYSMILSFVCVLLALDGCSAPPVTTSSSAFAPLVESDPLDPSFLLGLGILSGFDEPRAVALGQQDDWVLLGVKVSHQTEGASESDVWFVRLSTLPAAPPAPDSHDESAAPNATRAIREFSVPFGVGILKNGTKFKAPVGRILIETFDNQGALLRSSVRSVPQMSEAASLLDLWRPPSSAMGSSVSKEDVAGMMMMLHTLGTSRAIRPIRDAVRTSVIKKPKILGLLLNGLRMNVEADIAETSLVKTPWSADAPLAPRRQVHFPLLLTGQKLFDCRMVVGSPNPPYNLLGGTLLFEAVHPDKPQNRLTVRLLSAKRMPAERTLVSR